LSSGNDAGPGVPEALPRTLAMVIDRLGAERIDRLWIFPPLIRGRKEWGLVAASAYADDGERRFLHTAPYVAERTGQGLQVSHDLHEQGEAPSDRLPSVMSGVVHRSPEELGEPREVVVEGNPDTVAELMAEFLPHETSSRGGPEWYAATQEREGS
jgi:hypothetical protein